MNVSYNIINSVRMKLLLFIDKEIRANKKNNLKLLPKVSPEFNHLIKCEETFFHNKQDEIHFSCFQNQQNIGHFFKSAKEYTENHQNKILNNSIISIFENNKIKKTVILHSDFYPRNHKEKNKTTYLKSIREYNNKNYSNLSSNVIIDFKGKFYSIMTTKKTLSAKKLSYKSKKGGKYLKKLCYSLRIMKSKQIRIKSSICFHNSSMPKDKLVRVASSSHFFDQNKKRKGKGASTVKIVDATHRIKKKLNKIKLFQIKSIKKSNSNTNNIHIFPYK